MSSLLLAPPHRSILPWLAAVLVGLVAPALALIFLEAPPAGPPLTGVAGPILALGLMGAGMIGAAAAGRFWIGVGITALTGAGLVLLAQGQGLLSLPRPLSAALVVLIASISFAARGALFARSAASKGWWIAVAVVAGEAAVLITAATWPDALPRWLLALLPAQWASAGLQTVLAGTGAHAASSELLALAGTAAATLVVARLWPRRWPYLLMFTAWLGFSALVWHSPAPPTRHASTISTQAH